MQRDQLYGVCSWGWHFRVWVVRLCVYPVRKRRALGWSHMPQVPNGVQFLREQRDVHELVCAGWKCHHVPHCVCGLCVWSQLTLISTLCMCMCVVYLVVFSAVRWVTAQASGFSAFHAPATSTRLDLVLAPAAQPTVRHAPTAATVRHAMTGLDWWAGSVWSVAPPHTPTAPIASIAQATVRHAPTAAAVRHAMTGSDWWAVSVWCAPPLRTPTEHIASTALATARHAPTAATVRHAMTDLDWWAGSVWSVAAPII